MAGAALAGPAAAVARPPRPAPSLQRQVDAVYRTGALAVVARSTAPGSVRYASAGVADPVTGRPARPHDAFRTGSTTKAFVATVMLQLVAERRVSLDDTVEHWLPGVVSGHGNDGGRITVRRLLQHTSGLYNCTKDLPLLGSAEGFRRDRFRRWAPEQLVALATAHAPDFAPGARWSYSNTNYTLAGMIIEKATGHTWQQEVTRRIIRPLGLRHTYAPAHEPVLRAPALRGYSTFESGPLTDVTEFDPSGAGAAGALVTDADDLTAFFSALLRGRLLPARQLAEMKSTVRAEELDSAWPGARYGLGLMYVPLSCGGGYWGHGGDLPGYSTRNGTSEDGRRVVVVETTGDGTEEDLVTERARNTLLEQQLCATATRG
ncbi:beta-lactamase family protein [Streptomyces sp. LP05-1]|uniref:Beta-lactamase family protein n=1 Tax=Streptomyces pyxinae TaxID=2970734 RepID=A0ABT2CQE7_9ACTN|nr:serine hydrolase domain-containing protein [Streptomyces sp. LP05-1]MCS0639486.1 beta-lactamase family protein [Streptomyces sp. LP05-1]